MKNQNIEAPDMSKMKKLFKEENNLTPAPTTEVAQKPQKLNKHLK